MKKLVARARFTLPYVAVSAAAFLVWPGDAQGQLPLSYMDPYVQWQAEQMRREPYALFFVGQRIVMPDAFASFVQSKDPGVPNPTYDRLNKRIQRPGRQWDWATYTGATAINNKDYKRTFILSRLVDAYVTTNGQIDKNQLQIAAQLALNEYNKGPEHTFPSAVGESAKILNGRVDQADRLVGTFGPGPQITDEKVRALEKRREMNRDMGDRAVIVYKGAQAAAEESADFKSVTEVLFETDFAGDAPNPPGSFGKPLDELEKADENFRKAMAGPAHEAIEKRKQDQLTPAETKKAILRQLDGVEEAAPAPVPPESPATVPSAEDARKAFADKLDNARAGVFLVTMLGSELPLSEGERKALATVGGVASSGIDVFEAIGKFKLGEVSSLVMSANVVGAVFKVFSLFHSAPSEFEILGQQITELRNEVRDLHTEMRDRFNRVDERLNTVYETMVTGFETVLEANAQSTELLKEQLDLLNLKSDTLLSYAADFDRRQGDFFATLPLYLEDLERRLKAARLEVALRGRQLDPTFVLPQDAFLEAQAEFAFQAAAYSRDRLSGGAEEVRQQKESELLANLQTLPLERSLNLLSALLALRTGTDPRPKNPAGDPIRVVNPALWTSGVFNYWTLVRTWPEWAKTNTLAKLPDLTAAGSELDTFRANLRQPDLLKRLLRRSRDNLTAMQIAAEATHQAVIASRKYAGDNRRARFGTSATAKDALAYTVDLFAGAEQAERCNFLPLGIDEASYVWHVGSRPRARADAMNNPLTAAKNRLRAALEETEDKVQKLLGGLKLKLDPKVETVIPPLFRLAEQVHLGSVSVTWRLKNPKDLEINVSTFIPKWNEGYGELTQVQTHRDEVTQARRVRANTRSGFDYKTVAVSETVTYDLHTRIELVCEGTFGGKLVFSGEIASSDLTVGTRTITTDLWDENTEKAVRGANQTRTSLRPLAEFIAQNWEQGDRMRDKIVWSNPSPAPAPAAGGSAPQPFMGVAAVDYPAFLRQVEERLTDERRAVAALVTLALDAAASLKDLKGPLEYKAVSDLRETTAPLDLDLEILRRALRLSAAEDVAKNPGLYGALYSVNRLPDAETQRAAWQQFVSTGALLSAAPDLRFPDAEFTRARKSLDAFESLLIDELVASGAPAPWRLISASLSELQGLKDYVAGLRAAPATGGL